MLLMVCHYLGPANWYQLLTLAGLFYPIAQRHTFTVGLSSCCCLFLSPASSSFMLLFCLHPPPPHHHPVSADSPALSSHQPFCLRRVIKYHHHQCLDFFLLLLQLRADALGSWNLPVEFKWQASLSHIICCNKHFIYFVNWSLLF